MPFIGQLEPTALLQHLNTHPPDGFSLASTVGGTPSFATRFDLLTTADAPLRERIRALPLYRYWGRLLRPRTRFIGATVSEYAWLPAALAPDALADQLLQAHGRECPFLIVKDVLQDSPLLDARDNAYAAAFLQACRDAGFVLMAGQALAWVPIDFADEDAYLARLSRGARRDIRRKLRVRDRINVETLATGSAALCEPATLDACVALYEQVYAQSEVHFDHLDAGFLRAVLGDADCGGVVFVYRHEGRMIGWNLCFEHNGMLVDKYVGFDYPTARDFNLYAVSWMHNLSYACERGLTHYIAGWTDPEIKAHLGARFTFTQHAVRPRNRLLRALLHRIAPYFENDRNWHEQRNADAPRRP